MSLSFFKRLRRDKRGNVLMITAAGLPVLMGFVGLGTDTIQWALWKRQIQRGADSSAIAGVYQRIQAANTLSDVELAVNKDLTVNKNDVGAYVAGYPKIAFKGDDLKGKQKVEVELAVTKKLSFSGMFLSAPPVIKAKAVAAIVPGAEFCVISLETTSKTGILGDGNGTVNIGCGMITNSASLDAAMAKGSAVINTQAIAAVGGVQESNNWSGSEYLPFSLPIKDPFANVPATIPVGTPVRGAFSDSPGLTNTLQPGVYTKFDAKGKITLSPGTYFLNATDLVMGAQARIVGVGVTIVLTNADLSATAPIGGVKMTAGATLDISAPTGATDVYKGIALYQDRRAIDTMANGDTLSANSPNQLNGNSGTVITGAIYFPKQQITLTGNGTMETSCMLMVIKRIVFNGNGSTMNLRKNCFGTGASPFEGQAVRLIS